MGLYLSVFLAIIAALAALVYQRVEPITRMLDELNRLQSKELEVLQLIQSQLDAVRRLVMDRGGTTTAIPAAARRGSSNLSDRVLALATGKTQQEITAACKGARPNHVGAAIARHKRAGRIEERDEKLYAIRATGTEQPAAV
jgi:hypothetical protein